MSELSILIPEKTYQLGETEVTLKPFKFKHFPSVLDIVQKYAEALGYIKSLKKNIVNNEKLDGNESDDNESDDDKSDDNKSDDDEFMLLLFEKCDDKYTLVKDISTLITISSNLKKEDIEELTYDQIIAMFLVIFELNKDFFSQLSKKINPPKAETDNTEPKTGELKSAA